MTARGACAPNSICARIRRGAASSRRSAPTSPTRCSRKSTASPARAAVSLGRAHPSPLREENDSLPGRVRRILRQRADKDIGSAPKVDATEVEETAALIDFVAVCRTYASELAVNEVTLRTYSDLQHYVERSTESLVQSLRGGDTKSRSYRQMQVKAAIRFCEVLFGHDYASLMSRAAENAVVVERKPPRAG